MKRCVVVYVILIVSLLTLLAACGEEPRPRLDPRTLPTITPTPVTPVPGQGEYLMPLQGGQTVVPDDGRYTFVVPTGWYSIDVSIAEEFWVEPPAVAGEDPQITVNIVRENLSGIENPRQYAEIGQKHGAQMYSSIVTISSAPVRVGDRPAWRWLFTANVGAKGTLFYQLFIIDGRQGFVLTGSAPATGDERALQALFDSIAGSLQFVRG